MAEAELVVQQREELVEVQAGMASAVIGGKGLIHGGMDDVCRCCTAC